MNNVFAGTAASILISTAVLSGSSNAGVMFPFTEYQPYGFTPEVTEDLKTSCTFYKNVMTIAGRYHLNGSRNVRYSKNEMKEIATAGAQAMLGIVYSKIGYDPVTKELDKTIVTFSDKDSSDDIANDAAPEKNSANKEKHILSLRVGDSTVTYKEPPEAMMFMNSQCAYLQENAAALSEETGIPILRLYEYALNGALSEAVGPHTSYMWQENEDNFNTSISGEFGGLGIKVGMQDGVVFVESPIEDTPAFKAGLRNGDLITKLNGDPVLGKTLEEAVAIMRGEIGTDITLTVKRGKEEPFPLTITRDKIIIHAVKSKLIGENQDTAYIKLTTFSYKTTPELVDALKEFRYQAEQSGKPIKKVILDVRNNGGGLLTAGQAISDIFIEAAKGEKIPLVGVGKTRDEEITYAETVFDSIHKYDDGTLTPFAQQFSEYRNFNLSEFLPGAEIIVLQNQDSASASEIVAGALQDDGKKVYGQTSYGKGTVQTVAPITKYGLTQRSPKEPSIGSLRLTVAAFFPGKTGLSNQGSGIIPNVKVVYNDDRDKAVPEATHESKLKKALVSTEKTRAGQTPQLTCSLKTAFAGPLTESQIANIPEALVIDLKKLNKDTKKFDPVKMLDADLDCAMDRQYTDITPYTASVPTPQS